MSQGITQGKTSTKTIRLDAEVWGQFAAGSFQVNFLLCEADFLRTKNGKPITFRWAHGILLTSVGLGLSVIGKVLSAAWEHTVTVLSAIVPRTFERKF